MSYLVDVETTKVHTLKLTGKDIINLLNGLPLLDECRCQIQVPWHAEVSFGVPGGGDWSNCDIIVDDDAPVIVRWKTGDDD